MSKKYCSFSVIIVLWLLICTISCRETAKKPPVSAIVVTPEELDKKAPEIIQQSLEFAAANDGNIGDSVFLFNSQLSQVIYEKNQFTPLWSSKEAWKPVADSLVEFLNHCKLYGLFPEDYHLELLKTIRLRFNYDSLSTSFKRDAVLWSKADLMLTDAFIHLVKDIRLGRLPNDSVSLRKDSLLSNDFYIQQLDSLFRGVSLAGIMTALEPQHEGYRLIKAGLQKFLDSADNRIYTIVPSSKTDTLAFKKALQTRLFEGGYIPYDSVAADSLRLAAAVKKFQKQKNITVDGKAGEGTLRLLNITDRERFIRIAITLDRYKLLPLQMPERYIWVNLPSFTMKLQHGDSVVLQSKIICGKPITRTPLLTSAISEIITYPQWTVPNSIIVKEILPAIKQNPGYLARKGFSLVDKNGEEVDPFTVDWSKYSKGIPYKVVQGSGDANALGVLKFNFPNKYAVYLHDTNQRSLFGLAVRTLSHGCVRVQEWQKLADYIIRNDKAKSTEKIEVDTARVPLIDSLESWLSKKEKHSIPVRNRLPVYIRYFTCEGKSAGIVFYDDIYGEDKKLQERYFSGK
ncbi:MAG TPA: L,D-transpeptidase family protein [Chitinophagaceae bacterium]